MKNMFLGLMVAGAVLAGGVPAARAQGADPTIVKVPFSFIVGGKLLPAGTYRITTNGDDLASLMVVRMDGKGGGAFAATERTDNPAADGSDARVSFKMYDGQHFLWMVSGAGGEARQVVLREPQMERMLARLNLLPAERGEVLAK